MMGGWSETGKGDAKYFKEWDTTTTWIRVSDQYEYFSDLSNGYAVGEVVNVYTNSSQKNAGMKNVAVNDLSKGTEGLGVQPGDLVFFYNDEGKAHHAAVVSGVTDDKINYAANTTRRFDQSLKAALDAGGESKGAYIVRLKSRGGV